MPIDVAFYRERDGEVPVLAWIAKLDTRIRDKCVAKIIRLREEGHRLRRPEADFLRDGIHELRIVQAGRQYRILYFFHGNRAVVLTNALLKKTDEVPDKDIELAISRRKAFETAPGVHTHNEVTGK